VKTAFIAGIWLARFNSQDELENYVDRVYPDDGDDPYCRFASDAGLGYFDHDFLEVAYAETSAELLKNMDKLSFAANYKDQLLARLDKINYDNKNSIILLSGRKDNESGPGGVNDKLFDLVPVINDKDHLQFVGLFRFDL